MASPSMISIHALREEGDPSVWMAQGFWILFLSTPSARRATTSHNRNQHKQQISIHALREEGDLPLLELTRWTTYFYPRPPRGGRHPCFSRASASFIYFYPRPPRGGRQEPVEVPDISKIFLSTPSARRATPHPEQHHRLRQNFYPRPPRGGRPIIRFWQKPRVNISIHALREEGDRDAGETPQE